MRSIIVLIYIFFLIFPIFPDKTPLHLTEDRAVTIGITNSILLRTIKSKKEVYKLLITEKWRNYLPRVGVSYFGLKNLNINQSDSTYNDIRLNIQQLVYDGGQNSLEIESAKLEEILNAKDFNINRDKLALDIKKAYINVLSNLGKLNLIKKSLERSLDEIEELKLQEAKGFAIDFQVFEANSKLREIELSYRKILGETNRSIVDLKLILNIEIDTPIHIREEIFRDIYLSPPTIDLDRIAEKSIGFRNEIKKSKITIEYLKKQRDIAENYWKPQVSLGGYVGENVNGPLPVTNKVYGFNVTVNAKLGSTTNSNTANYGVQTDGSGIQRIPGFGPQFVGKGENAFNSSNLQFFDDLSYSRKIVEGQIKLSEAIHNHQLLEKGVVAEVFKSYDTLQEKWQLIRIANSRMYLQYQALDLATKKYKEGFAKKTDLIKVELEFVKTMDGLAESIRDYILASYDFSFSSGLDGDEIHFAMYKENQGNSLIFHLFPDYWNTSHLNDFFDREMEKSLEISLPDKSNPVSSPANLPRKGKNITNEKKDFKPIFPKKTEKYIDKGDVKDEKMDFFLE